MKYDAITLERLKELLNYDPTTGIFTWKIRPFRNSRKKPGDVAGVLKNRGYRYIGIDSRTYLASQLAWFYHYGVWAKAQVGARDGDPSNLRIENLYEMRTAPGKHDFNTKQGLAVYRKAFRKANPGAHREYGFKRYYGISSKDYQERFLAQGGVCAICKCAEDAKTPEGDVKWLSVDHCHNSSAIRGLLCSSCNRMLGFGRDNPEVLRAAAEYLEKANAVPYPKGKVA